MALADLGSLGAREGSSSTYNWTTPSLLPLLLPWIGILLLLMLRSNRCARAWLIWLPLGAVFGLASAAGAATEVLPSELLESFINAVGALAFGLAAVWLLAQQLGRRQRALTFFGTLGVLAGASMLTFVSQQEWESDWTSLLPGAILLGVSVLVVALALLLAGLCCRRRYRPVALCGWLLVWVLGLWLLAATPFLLIALFSSPGFVPWEQFLVGVLVLAGVNLATLVPFLILSFASAFYRERLRALLHLTGELPPLIVPSPVSTGPA